MIEVFVINAEGAVARIAALASRMRTHRVPFHRWAATSGADIDGPAFGRDETDGGAQLEGFSAASANEAARGVSHIRLLRHLVREGPPWAIVLEDDGVVTRGFPLDIESWQAPPDADIILLNGRACAESVCHAGDPFSYGEVTGGAGTEGYMVSLAGARKLLRVLSPLRGPAPARSGVRLRLLCVWAAYLEVTENLAIRFEYRGAWVSNPEADGPTPVLADQAASGGESIEVFKLLREAPDPPPTWMTREPDLVRMLREQWRGYRSGEAKLLDRAYFCLTAIEATYGGRKRAAETLRVSGALLSRIGRLAASQDRKHARKLTGGGPATLSAGDREWLNRTIPRLILRCAEIELGRRNVPVLQNRATRQVARNPDQRSRRGSNNADH